MLLELAGGFIMTRPQSRKSTNLSLDQALLADARALNINLSRAAEEGIRTAVAKSREEHWKAENQEAMESSNRFVEQKGLPLAQFRRF
jgi:antitoxin CcdA